MTGLERWCDEFALVVVKISFARKNAITYGRTKGTVERIAFVEVRGVID
jgi:hypothetical protein